MRGIEGSVFFVIVALRTSSTILDSDPKVCILKIEMIQISSYYFAILATQNFTLNEILGDDRSVLST